MNLLPEVKSPEGKTLTDVADENGNWSILIDFPIPSGVKKATFQGQKDKILTPVSEEITFEISQAKGGSLTILTDQDKEAPAPPAPIVKGERLKLPKIDFQNKTIIYEGIALIVIIASGISAVVMYFKQR